MVVLGEVLRTVHRVALEEVPVGLGDDFERRVKAALERTGWFVVRVAGSHGVADLLAIGEPVTIGTFYGNTVRNGSRIAMVQCKRGGLGRCPPAEWNALYESAQKYGADAVLAYKVQRGVIGWKVITGTKAGIKGKRAPVRNWTGMVTADEAVERVGLA